MTLLVKISEPNFIEKKYAIEVLFKYFLGIEYHLEKSSLTNKTTIELPNGNRIDIEDHFFSRYQETYLKREHLPSQIKWLNSTFNEDSPLPIIYGADYLDINKTGKFVIITLGLDLIASIFFMLSRWEEYVNRKRDRHGRFPAEQSLAYQHGFLNRPIVNEYAEFLKIILVYLDYNYPFPKRKFRFIPTHDVDHLFYPKHSLRDYLANIAHGRWGIISNAIKRNPYNTFSCLMDISESKNVQSHFFFMVSAARIFRSGEDTERKEVKDIVDKIKARGHVIGFHPDRGTYRNLSFWHKELREIQQSFEVDIKEFRQHYLQFSVPETWEIGEKNEMKIDSSLTYPEVLGFRCGSCYEFPVFDCVKRKQYKLTELPISVMDGTLIDYLQYSPEDSFDAVKEMFHTIRRFHGDFVILWHNHSFRYPKWLKYRQLYKEIIHLK